MDNRELYYKTFCKYLTLFQEHISVDDKKEIINTIDECTLYELFSFLTFGDILIECNEFIEESFYKSDIGKFLFEEERKFKVIAPGKKTKPVGYLPSIGYAIGKTLQTVGGSAVKGAANTAWSGTKYVGKKAYNKMTSDKPSKPGIATGFWHSLTGIDSKKPPNIDIRKNIEKQKNLSKLGKVAAWTAIPAAAIAAGTLLYKKYLSKAARSCNGAPDKQECIKNYKTNALKAQIEKLNQSRSKCTSSKDPLKCAEKIDELIAKKRTQISKL